MWEHSRDTHGGVLGEDGGMRDYEFSVTGYWYLQEMFGSPSG